MRLRITHLFLLGLMGIAFTNLDRDAHAYIDSNFLCQISGQAFLGMPMAPTEDPIEYRMELVKFGDASVRLIPAKPAQIGPKLKRKGGQFFSAGFTTGLGQGYKFYIVNPDGFEIASKQFLNLPTKFELKSESNFGYELQENLSVFCQNY